MLAINIRKLNPLASFGNREIVGMDFGGNNLKLAHMKMAPHRTEIVNLSYKNIKGLSEDDISKVIRASFEEQKIKKADIIDIIPSHLVITKNIEIPSRNPQEIREIVNLQAGRHTPYSRDEIIVDYIDIGTYKHNYTKVLLVIVARKVIKRQFEILDKAGLKLERVLFATESTGRFISKTLKLEAKTSPTSIVHIDEGFTDFVIIFRRKVLYTRSIPIGTAHLVEEKELYSHRFVEEVKNSLEAYGTEDIEKMPDNVILTGAIEQVKDLEPLLNNTLHIPAKNLNYFEHLPLVEDILKSQLLTGYMSFLDITASFFILNEMKVNFIPEEIKLRKTFEEKGKDIIKTGILILTAFILICSILISKIYFKGVYLRNLNSKYQSQHKMAQKLEKDFARVQTMRNYLASRGYSLEVLGELYEVLPLNIQLSDIEFAGQGKFSIKGTAESMAAVFSYVEDMEKSKYFKDVKTRYTSKKKKGNENVADFEITCLLSKEVD